MKKSVICIISLSVIAFANISFAQGTFLGGNYYDYNKGSSNGTNLLGNGTNGIDGMLCWAASASNSLQWWQTQVSNGGFTNIDKNILANLQNSNGNALPNFASNISNTESYTLNASKTGVESYSDSYKNSTFYTFVMNWKDDGLTPLEAYKWWFNGTAHASLDAGSKEGGYIKNVSWNALVSTTKGKFVNTVNTINLKLKAELLSKTYYKNLDSFAATVKQGVKQGVVLNLGIFKNEQDGHALTTYGYKYNKDGQFVLIVSDSDDAFAGTKEVKMAVENGKIVFLDDYVGYNIDYMTGFVAMIERKVVKSKTYSLNALADATEIDGVFYFGRDPDVEIADGDYSSATLWSDDNMLFTGNSAIWIDIDMDYAYDSIECSGFFGKSDNWVDGEKLFIDIKDFSGLGEYLNELVGEAILIASFDETNFTLADFVLSGDINGYFEFASDGKSLNLILVPEPSAYALLFGVLISGIIFYRRRL